MAGDDRNESPAAHEPPLPPPPPDPAAVPPVPWADPRKSREPVIPPGVLRVLGIAAFVGLLALAWFRVNLVLRDAAVTDEWRGGAWAGAFLGALLFALVIRFVIVKVRRRGEAVLSPWVPILALGWMAFTTVISAGALLRAEAARGDPTPTPDAGLSLRIDEPFELGPAQREVLGISNGTAGFPVITRQVTNHNGVGMGAISAGIADGCSLRAIDQSLEGFLGRVQRIRIGDVETIVADGDTTSVLWCEGDVLVIAYAVTRPAAEALAAAVLRVPAGAP